MFKSPKKKFLAGYFTKKNNVHIHIYVYKTHFHYSTDLKLTINIHMNQYNSIVLSSLDINLFLVTFQINSFQT